MIGVEQLKMTLLRGKLVQNLESYSSAVHMVAAHSFHTVDCGLGSSSN